MRCLNLFSVILAASLGVLFAVSCGQPEPDEPTPTPVTPDNPTPPAPDTTAPTITVSKGSVNVIAGLEVTVSGSELMIGGESIATWKDDVSSTCTAELTMTPKEGAARAVKNGDKLSEDGTLQLKVTDEADNSSTADIILTREDSVAPVITVSIEEKNVIAGMTVSVIDNQLLFDDSVAATWTDDYSATCTVELSLTAEGETSPKPINSGDVLTDAGTLTLTVSDDFQNKASADINLTAIAVYGLDNLSQLQLKVDQEADLLQGVTFAEGVSLEKVEIEQGGTRSVVPDPSRFIPGYPGPVSIILTLRTGSGTLEEKVDNLEIKPLQFHEPLLETVNLADAGYAWFNVLTEKTKGFIYDHILTSYINSEWYSRGDLIYIIMGEIPEGIDCENVGQDKTPTRHALHGFYRIKGITPNATIKACGGGWGHLLPYLNQNPDKMYMVSCASDKLGSDTREPFLNSENYGYLKSILKQENVVISIAFGNIIPGIPIEFTTLNEDMENTDLITGQYTSASVNSEINNKIAVVGFNPNKNNIFLDDSQTRLPIGYGKGNIIVPFISLFDGDIMQEDQTTGTSYPTAAQSSSLGNFLSIIMANHPGSTLEDANTIMQEQYLRGEKYKFKDTDGSIKEGGDWYFYDTDKFIREEILHRAEVEVVVGGDFSTSLEMTQGGEVTLPAFPGACYQGIGIQFTVDGTVYDMTEENRSILENAVKAGIGIKWTYNPDRAKKYGVSGSGTITVQVLDKQARRVPDVSMTVQVK